LKVTLDREEALMCHISAWISAKKYSWTGTGGQRTYTKDKTLHESIAYAGLSSVLPVILRYINPKDKSFGVTGE